MPETKGLVTLSASGGSQVAAETDRARRGLQDIVVVHDRLRGTAERGISVRHFHLLSTALGQVTGGGSMAAGAMRELIYVVEGGVKGLTSTANIIGLVVAAISAAVGAWISYRHSQEQASKAVAASWKEHQALKEKLDEAVRSGVSLTGTLAEYATAVNALAAVTRGQLIVEMKKQSDTERESIRVLKSHKDTTQELMSINSGMSAGMLGIVSSGEKVISTYERMTPAERAVVDARVAALAKLDAEIDSLERFGTTNDVVLARVTQRTNALRQSTDALRESQLQLLALDPAKGSLAASLRIADQLERKYEDLRRAGVDSATARAQAEAWAANQTRLLWFQSMAEVQGVLTTGFKEAFMQIGHGIEGMEKAWSSFRDAVINMIAEMAARALAFQVISGVGSGLGLFGGIAGALGLGPAGPVTAAFSTVAQHGAEIPGPWGQPRLVIAHGGETISAPSGRGSPVRGGTASVQHVHFHQGVLDSSAVRQVVRNTKRAQGSLGEKRF